MTRQIAVFGGVYREICRLPLENDDTWGSGGRAAAVIAGLGLRVVLYTAVDAATEILLASLANIFNFEVNTIRIDMTRQFRYNHALSAPIIYPAERNKSISIREDVEKALVFGMIEAKVEVRANQIVYDPQDPGSPEPFRPATGRTPRLAYVLNRSEASKLTKVEDPEEAGRRIIVNHGAEVVVVKCGPWGALVCDGRHSNRVPAYATQRVWPIGSGDVFAAVFAARWACDGMPALDAAQEASRAVALYVNDRVLPIDSNTLRDGSPFPFVPLPVEQRALQKGEFHVYLAGPFFNMAQRWLVVEARLALRGLGLRVFSPLHDVGLGRAHDVAPKDIEGLKASRAILALVDGLDPGTIFEIGYARSIGRPVVALAESTPDESLKMLMGTECQVVPDFVAAIYRTAWVAQA